MPIDLLKMNDGTPVIPNELKRGGES